MKPAQGTIVTAGVLHLGGLRATAPFILVDHLVGPRLELNGGYVRTTQAINGSNPANNILRAGVTYKHDIGPFLLENRLLYEAILNAHNREDGNRLRNRTRMTYDLAPGRSWEPRVFGHLEPVLDDRHDSPLRLDMALGCGVTMASRWRLDLFALRQTYPARSRSGLNALVFQLFVTIDPMKAS